MKIKLYIILVFIIASPLAMAQLHISNGTQVQGLEPIYSADTKAVTTNKTLVFIAPNTQVVGLEQLSNTNASYNLAIKKTNPTQSLIPLKINVRIPKEGIALSKNKQKIPVNTKPRTTIKHTPFNGHLPFNGGNSTLKTGIAALLVINNSVQQQHLKNIKTSYNYKDVVGCMYKLPAYNTLVSYSIYNHTYNSNTYSNALHSRPPPRYLV